MSRSMTRYYLSMPPLIGDIGSKYKRALEVEWAKINSVESNERRLWGQNPGQVVARVPLSHTRGFYEAAYSQKPYTELWLIEDTTGDKGYLADASRFRFVDVRVNSCDPYQGDVIVTFEYKRAEVKQAFYFDDKTLRYRFIE